MAFRMRPVLGSTAAVIAALVSVPAFSSVAIAAPEAVGDPAAPPETAPSPEAISAPDVAEPGPAPELPASDPAGDEASVPEPAAEVPDVAAPPEPAPVAQEPVPAVAEPVAAEPAPTEGGIDPTLLDAQPVPEPAAPVTTRAAGTRDYDSPEERHAAIEAAYAARYRPADNPLRLNVAGRVMFANVSGQDRVNGRLGGASVDIGPSWNRVGIAATFTGWGGSILLPENTGAQLNGMAGGGLTLGLGRLALLSHGFLDVRVGYDIYYGAVNQRSDATAILATQASDPQFVATLTENVLPHGPRLRIDMGLVGAGNRRYFHGFGLSMGYQALVGSINGGLPPTNMLTLGFSYWMG